MPNNRQSVIEINSVNIAPWLNTTPSIRYNQTEGLRRQFRQNNYVKHEIYLHINYYKELYGNHPIDNNNALVDYFSLPPLMMTVNRIWNDYIFSNNRFVSLEITIPSASDRIIVFDDGSMYTNEPNNIIQMLSEKIPFHEFYGNITLNNIDIWTYKYCVILAGLNILTKIFNIIFPQFSCNNLISYIYPSASSDNVCYKFDTLYKININIEKLILLITKIPIVEYESQSEISYYDFWNYLWRICSSTYMSVSNDRQTSEFPINLTEEYLNRTNSVQDFMNKKQIISMIEKSFISDNVLHSIYNIIK